MAAAGAQRKGAKKASEAWEEEEPWGGEGDPAEWEEAPRKGKRRKQKQEDAKPQEEAWAEEAPRKGKRRKQLQEEALAEEGGAEEPDGHEAAAAEEEAAPEDDPAAGAKWVRRTKKQVKAEALEPGAVVLYWGDRRGIIRDSFAPLDEFWVADESSGQLVRDEDEEIISFVADDLVPVATAPNSKYLVQEVDGADGTPTKAGKVLLIGQQSCVVEVLEHFGEPDARRRQEPQQLLAIPCDMCDPSQLQAAAHEGVDEQVKALAERAREDIHVAVRALHLKRLVSLLAPDIQRLEGYYCLASVSTPYGREAIEASETKRERRLREDVWCQIDLCTTAAGQYPDEDSAQAAAQRALGEMCGVSLGERVWTDEVQLAARNRLGVPLLPFRLMDADGVEVFVLILPEGTESRQSQQANVLCFDEPRIAPAVKPHFAEKPSGSQSAARGAPAKGAEAGHADAIAERMGLRGQGLPPGWERCQSRSNGKVYFFNRNTQETTYTMPEAPLPRGWKRLVSKSNGKPYYFNAGRQLSQYDRPTE